MIPSGLKILQHENDASRASSLLRSIAAAHSDHKRQQRRHSHSLEEENDTKSRSKKKKRGKRRRPKEKTTERRRLLQHDDDDDDHIDPRDEDVARSHRRNLSSSEIDSLITECSIPTVILYQRFSYIPLEHVDVWLWRTQMHDGFLYFIIKHRESALALRRFDVRRSIGWSSKAMSSLLQRTMNITTFNGSECQSIDDRILLSMGKFCPLLVSLNIAKCKKVTGKGLLAIVEGVASRKLVTLNVSSTNVATQSDGGRLFISAVCIRCTALKKLLLAKARGLRVGAFEAVLASTGNILEAAVATVKLPSIQVLDVSNLSGGMKKNTTKSKNNRTQGRETKYNDAEGDSTTSSDNGMGLSEKDMEGFLLCIHKNLRQINLNHCARLTDDGFRSVCHKKTSWGYQSHRGTIHLHTISLRGCTLLSDVSMGWVSTGCPNVEVLDLGNCITLTDWGLRALNRMPQLRVLRLDGIENITMQGMRMLMVGEEGSPATTGPSLYEIDVSCCLNLQPDPFLRLLAEKAISLTTLSIQNIKNIEIDWKPLQILVKNCKWLRNFTFGPGKSKHKRGRKKDHKELSSMPSSMMVLPNVNNNDVASSSRNHQNVRYWPSLRALGYVAKYLRTTMLHLDLSGTPVQTLALSKLQHMNHLLTLNVEGCLYIDDNFFSILPNWKLEELNISSCPLLTDHGIQSLKTCYELKILRMNHISDITDDGLLALLVHHLPTLHTLECVGCRHITYEGSLQQIVQSKKRKERIIFTKNEKTKKVIGFHSSTYKDALNHQHGYSIETIRIRRSAIIVQQWWKTYIRQVFVLRQAKVERVKKKLASIHIQRVWRGGCSREKTTKDLKYKAIVIRRLELAYIRRVKWKLKRKALNFFLNRALAATFHTWLNRMQEAKHARGEQSEHDRIKRATKALFGRLLDRYFRKWQTFVWTQKRRHGRLGKALQFASSKSEAKWLHVWYNNVIGSFSSRGGDEHRENTNTNTDANTTKRRRKLLSSIYMLCVPTTHDNSRLSHRQHKKSKLKWKLQLEKVWFRMWCTRALEQRQILRKRARKVYKRYITTVLREWLVQAKIIKEEKRRFQQIVMRMKHGKAIRILQAWQVVAGELRDLRKALACFTMSLVRNMIYKWKEMIVNIKYQRYLEERGDKHYVRRLRTLTAQTWHAWMLEQKRQQRMLLKALRLMRNRLAVQTIEIWKQFIVYKHEQLRKAIHKSLNSTKYNAFQHWYSLAAGRLERIRCAILIQSVFRGYQRWSQWPKELSAYKWAVGKNIYHTVFLHFWI
jgi:hypothetical protein